MPFNIGGISIDNIILNNLEDSALDDNKLSELEVKIIVKNLRVLINS